MDGSPQKTMTLKKRITLKFYIVCTSYWFKKIFQVLWTGKKFQHDGA